MKLAITKDHALNLYVLHYNSAAWIIRNLILIPHFALSLSAIEKRKPLGPNARRAGWIGCYILLGAIPPDARISVVTDGKALPQSHVREQLARLRPLEKLGVEKRGWTLDVLNVVRSLKKKEFGLADVYAHEHALARLHLDNRHVRDKIRQQLQILRDAGLLEFLGSGEYRVP